MYRSVTVCLRANAELSLIWMVGQHLQHSECVIVFAGQCRAEFDLGSGPTSVALRLLQHVETSECVIVFAGQRRAEFDLGCGPTHVAP